ncbi:protein-tyrosine phosphatase family protein [Vulcanisaeta souniana]|uniref:Protein phosphatase n=1 Tax=Vulcanisaeta souniana JCM 11219 TaxID=1293586 RepID=A0A830EDS8_9CREN|nr:dual specificity protein phosphatase family protein [Vulcanisaeta souniana]BDR91416.1 protein phosphatase [Vulcanisaeta souniana JCM 11219]GGI72971.1 protein phosphatase [Vulcanisaeta souniana JCM 11219]
MVKFPYWVVEGALAGSSMPYDEDTVAMWHKMGIRAIVVLVEEWEFAMEGWEFHDYINTLRRLGMDYLHIPTRDGYAPTEETLYSISTWIDRNIMNGKPVLVHCHAGIGRSPTVIAAYLMYRRGLNANDAIEVVSRYNDEVSITNEQYLALVAFEHYLRSIRNSGTNTP